jgi:hypothetical protein
MFGFETGENLFLDDGKWDARYLPLAIDIQPFLIGGSPTEGGDKQVHVDLASPRIAAGMGYGVFDEAGRPTPYLESITDKLGELDLGYRESEAFFAALDRYELLEPLTWRSRSTTDRPTAWSASTGSTRTGCASSTPRPWASCTPTTI